MGNSVRSSCELTMAMDITIPIQEGEKYRLKAINFKNNKAIVNSQLLRTLFPIKDGDIFDTHQIQKGIENLRKAYGEIGYINFTSVPETQIDDEHKLLTLNGAGVMFWNPLGTYLFQHNASATTPQTGGANNDLVLGTGTAVLNLNSLGTGMGL